MTPEQEAWDRIKSTLAVGLKDSIFIAFLEKDVKLNQGLLDKDIQIIEGVINNAENNHFKC